MRHTLDKRISDYVELTTNLNNVACQSRRRDDTIKFENAHAVNRHVIALTVGSFSHRGGITDKKQPNKRKVYLAHS